MVSVGDTRCRCPPGPVASSADHPERLRVLARGRRSNPPTEASRGEGCYSQVRWSHLCRHRFTHIRTVAVAHDDRHSLPQPSPGPVRLVRALSTAHPKGEQTLTRTVGALAEIQPDYFSVTYGASGSTRNTSRDLIGRILSGTPVTPLAHLTCVGASEEDLSEYVSSLLEAGVRDFLALRGDPPAGQPDWRPHPDGLTRASQLVHLLRRLATEHLAATAPTSASVWLPTPVVPTTSPVARWCARTTSPPCWRSRPRAPTSPSPSCSTTPGTTPNSFRQHVRPACTSRSCRA